MKQLFAVIIVLVALASHTGIANAGTKSLSHLVTPAWVEQHASDPNLILLQVAWSRHEYSNGHIPGAVFIWPDWYAPSNPDASTELPPLADLKSKLEQLGVGDNSEIVIYGTENQMTLITRLFMTLDYLGLADHAHILDGGIAAWTEAGKKLSTDTPPARTGTITPHLKESAVVQGDWMAAHYKDAGIQVVDARNERFYNGANGGMNRAGHIPGAVNLPYNTLADTTNRYKDPDTLRAMFAKAGIKQGDHIVAYCHVGQQATMVYFVGRCLGYDVTLYDGSFEDWSNRKELPVEVPPKSPDKK